MKGTLVGIVESAYEYWKRHQIGQVAVYVVDAFTDRPYAGNPAGVCLIEEEATPDSGWMQRVAAEMNLSETAFVQARRGGAGYQLRWFTPVVEVNLCGHATLAAAHTLWWNKIVPADESITFYTRSGPLICVQRDGWIAMNFPAMPADVAVEGQTFAAVEAALGLKPNRVVRNREMILAELADERTVREALPDFATLRELDAIGLIITAPSRESDAYDIVCRFFAPVAGIDEDPVTGSAHCALGPYWFDRLGKATLISYQASLRGGTVQMEKSNDPQRITLAGQAVQVMRAELSV